MNEQIERGIYQHFKGNLYMVEGTARHSETGELLVIYRPLYGDYRLTARPYAMFTEKVKDPSSDGMVQRFRFEQGI